MTRDELIERAARAMRNRWSMQTPPTEEDYANAAAVARHGLLADPEQRRPVVLMRSEDCMCPVGGDCPHGPEPVDALDLMRWLHAESEWWLSQYKHDVVLWRQQLTAAEERIAAADAALDSIDTRCECEVVTANLVRAALQGGAS